MSAANYPISMKFDTQVRILLLTMVTWQKEDKNYIISKWRTAVIFATTDKNTLCQRKKLQMQSSQYGRCKRNMGVKEEALFCCCRFGKKHLIEFPDRSWARLTYYARKSVQGSALWAAGRTRKKRSRVNILMRNFAHTGKKKLKGSWLYFACRASVWLEAESEALFTTWFSYLAQVALHGKIFLEANCETRYVTVER